MVFMQQDPLWGEEIRDCPSLPRAPTSQGQRVRESGTAGGWRHVTGEGLGGCPRVLMLHQW